MTVLPTGRAAAQPPAALADFQINTASGGNGHLALAFPLAKDISFRDKVMTRFSPGLVILSQYLGPEPAGILGRRESAVGLALGVTSYGGRGSNKLFSLLAFLDLFGNPGGGVNMLLRSVPKASQGGAVAGLDVLCYLGRQEAVSGGIVGLPGSAVAHSFIALSGRAGWQVRDTPFSFGARYLFTGELSNNKTQENKLGVFLAANPGGNWIEFGYQFILPGDVSWVENRVRGRACVNLTLASFSL